MCQKAPGDLSLSLWEKRTRNVYSFVAKFAKVVICLMIRPYAQHLELLLGDFMKINLPYFDICVANVPYKVLSSSSSWTITTTLLRLLKMILSSPSLSSQDLFSYRVQTAFAQARPTVCIHTSRTVHHIQ